VKSPVRRHGGPECLKWIEVVELRKEIASVSTDTTRAKIVQFFANAGT
jgi:hypothetical protein